MVQDLALVLLSDHFLAGHCTVQKDELLCVAIAPGLYYECTTDQLLKSFLNGTDID